MAQETTRRKNPKLPPYCESLDGYEWPGSLGGVPARSIGALARVCGNVIRMKKLLFLSAAIWAVMFFSPDPEGPVFNEGRAEPEAAAPALAAAAPAPEPAVQTEPAPAPLPAALVELAAATAMEATPEPAEPVAAVAPEPEPEPEPAALIRYVTGKRVNVRSGPSTDYGILDQVVLGDAAEVISDPAADWVQIRIEGDGVEGWIAARFLTEDEPNY